MLFEQHNAQHHAHVWRLRVVARGRDLPAVVLRLAAAGRPRRKLPPDYGRRRKVVHACRQLLPDSATTLIPVNPLLKIQSGNTKRLRDDARHRAVPWPILTCCQQKRVSWRSSAHCITIWVLSWVPPHSEAPADSSLRWCPAIRSRAPALLFTHVLPGTKLTKAPSLPVTMTGSRTTGTRRAFMLSFVPGCTARCTPACGAT